MAGDFGDLIGAFSTAPRMRPGERVRYVPSRVGFGAFIRSDQVRDPVVEVAEDIAASAATKVSDGSAGGLHDRVRKRFKVKRKAGLLKVAGNLRVKVEVFNDEPGSALVEFGARNIQRDRPLGRAGPGFGDFKPDEGPN